MRYWGISALSHDSSIAVVEDDTLVFAAHSERYSRSKNDTLLHSRLIEEVVAFGPPDEVVWYERPFVKKLRHARAGQWTDAVSRDDVPRTFLRSLDLPFDLPDITYVSHHRSHAAASIATSGFAETAVIVADAIGEFRTFTIGYSDQEGRFNVLHRRSYPHSLGLLYSAFTRRCGYKPNEDEFIIMGMAAYGDPLYTEHIYNDLLEVAGPTFRLRVNVHRGIGDWLSEARPEDLAASIQKVTEEIMLGAARWAHEITGSENLVLAGGVALNCVANTVIASESGFENVWIFPNPGDAGSSVGAIAAVTGRPLRWNGPYLGTEIPGEYPVEHLLDALCKDGFVGVANGRAEFGPRALGNRSLLADPRRADMKDKVNQIKGREPFRPFAPVVRLEHAHELFELAIPSAPYMQFTARCRYPGEFPATLHHDGTSRVQTVGPDDHPGLHALLGAWEDATGCPVLLNTSLNVRGEPLVNTVEDADHFALRTSLAVF